MRSFLPLLLLCIITGCTLTFFAGYKTGLSELKKIENRADRWQKLSELWQDRYEKMGTSLDEIRKNLPGTDDALSRVLRYNQELIEANDKLRQEIKNLKKQLPPEPLSKKQIESWPPAPQIPGGGNRAPFPQEK